MCSAASLVYPNGFISLIYLVRLVLLPHCTIYDIPQVLRYSNSYFHFHFLLTCVPFHLGKFKNFTLKLHTKNDQISPDFSFLNVFFSDIQSGATTFLVPENPCHISLFCTNSLKTQSWFFTNADNKQLLYKQNQKLFFTFINQVSGFTLSLHWAEWQHSQQ